MIHRTPLLSTRDYYKLHCDEPNLITATRLKRLKNPFREKWLKEDISDSPAVQRGDLVDCLWLVPNEFDRRFCLLPDDAPTKPTKRQIDAKKPSPDTVAAIQFWAAFSQKAAGKTIISAEQLEEAKRIVGILNEHPDTSHIHAISEKQIAASCEADYFGHDFIQKILIDLLPTTQDSEYGDCIFDLKVYSVIEDEDISRHIENLDVHVRAAHYLDTYNAACDHVESPRHRYCLIVVEPDAGEIKLVQIDEEDIREGRELIEERIANLLAFRARGEPKVAYHRGLVTIKRPSWAKKRDRLKGLISEPASFHEIS